MHAKVNQISVELFEGATVEDAARRYLATKLTLANESAGCSWASNRFSCAITAEPRHKACADCRDRRDRLAAE